MKMHRNPNKDNLTLGSSEESKSGDGKSQLKASECICLVYQQLPSSGRSTMNW